MYFFLLLPTLLTTFDYPGLEVETADPTTGIIEYRKVARAPGTLVANIGDMLSRFSGGKLKATMHRVKDIGIDRYSVPFFLEPKFHAEISRGLQTTDENGKEVLVDPIKFGEW